MKKFSAEADKNRVERLYKYEAETRAEGFKLIAGVDEAGRGSLVGAVVVAATVLPENLYLERLDDSKKLSAKTRETLYEQIISEAISWNVVCVDIEEIDKLNIYQATLIGMKRAVAGLDVQPDFVLTDAMKVDFGEKIPSRSIIHGDALSASIAAASILAKVTRDRLADQWALKYPQYGFEHNRGYGTEEHLAAIEKFGACPLHRKSFNPVKSLIGK
ncbi:MAG: ribonuclease HII [Selenomonadaceae bacterium]|nr:ribonuclease HII [Selenomonadaceae bacterium]